MAGSVVRHYFVDEAGDLTLFDARGRVIIGEAGVSRAFLVGVAEIEDVGAVSEAMRGLRSALLADPYFRNVPSMQISQRKTAIEFHAKNDLPEVRREVFRLLSTLGVKVQVAIRRKDRLAEAAKWLHATRGMKLSASDEYDDLVKRLFKGLLHKSDGHEVCFARRGKGDRQKALEVALERAQGNAVRSWMTASRRPFVVRSSVPSQEAGLQVVDYFLWALQRLLERGEDRYFASVADQYRLIMDLDDTREKPYGAWYSQRNPLSLEKIKPLSS
jgi:hypothetical protein